MNDISKLMAVLKTSNCYTSTDASQKPGKEDSIKMEAAERSASNNIIDVQYYHEYKEIPKVLRTHIDIHGPGFLCHHLFSRGQGISFCNYPSDGLETEIVSVVKNEDNRAHLAGYRIRLLKINKETEEKEHASILCEDLPEGIHA
jgi:hypothetical protein